MWAFTAWQKAVRLAASRAIIEKPSAWPPQPPIISITFSLGFLLLSATMLWSFVGSAISMPPSPVLGFLKRPCA